MTTTLSVRELAVQYRRRLVFRHVSFDLGAARSLGVVGANGAGKTTLLRTLAGLIAPCAGDIRINGLMPRDALRRCGLAYFAGGTTLPGSVRAADWGSLGNGDPVTAERRRIRTLSRGTRQFLGLRTVLGRHPLGLVVLDEPWEGLDPDGSRWLSTILETKRDRGAAVVLSSHRPADLAGLCDAYLFLLPHTAVLRRSHETAPRGGVTAEVLAGAFETVRDDPAALRPIP